MTPRSEAALTLFEVGVVLALLLILAAIVLPSLAVGRQKPSRIACTNHLMQIGITYRVWAGDSNDKYPMEISITNGGTRELSQTGNAVASYQIMSNELSTPYILICPGDTNRVFATNFAALSNSNVSYLVGVEARESYPQMIISGDSDLMVNDRAVKAGLLALQESDSVSWKPNWHGPHHGNLGLADGSVQVPITAGRNFLLTGPGTNRFAIP
jgi:hypothetical protein